LAWIAIFLSCLQTGCEIKNEGWPEKMISEMEAAWIKADNAGGRQEDRAKAVNQVVQTYFRPGMPKADAFDMLMRLKEQGFNIGEYRHEGARNWPDGDLKPYLDEQTKKNLENQIPPGISRISASKQHGKSNFLIYKHIGITLITRDHDDVILSSDGAIGLSSI